MRVLITLPIVLFGCMTAGMAQRPVEPPKEQRPAEPKTPGTPKETPKDAAKDATEPVDPNAPTAPNAAEETAEYSGPAILSRNFTVNRPSVSRRLKFRPYAGIGAIYDTGLTGAFLTPTGTIENGSAYGFQADFGISGSEARRLDQFSLAYRGTIFHYPNRSSYDGTNHVLMLTYSRQATKHVSLHLQESAGLYSNNYGLINDAALTDLSVANTTLLVSPNIEPFDNRSLYLSSGADVVFQKSARLSMDVGLTGFLVRRRSSSLYGTAGYQTRGDMIYRLTKRTSLGPYYAFSHYEFNKAFGGADIHTVGLSYSVALSKTLELALRGGGSRVETQGVLRVPVDPIIAQVLGISFGVRAFYSLNYIPDGSASLKKNFRVASLSAAYAQGVTPGNGLYLTSKHETEALTYTYTGIHLYSFEISGGHDSLGSLGQTLGAFNSYFARAGVNRKIGRNVDSTFRVDYRRYVIDVSNFRRDQLRFSLGITWSPGEGPLRPW